MLKEITGNEQPSVIDLHETLVILQAYDMSLNSRNKEKTDIIGNKMEKYIACDIEGERK